MGHVLLKFLRKPQPGKSPPWARGIDSAIAQRRAVRDARHACMTCDRTAALLTLSFEGLRVGTLCRFCGASALLKPKKK